MNRVSVITSCRAPRIPRIAGTSGYSVPGGAAIATPGPQASYFLNSSAAFVPPKPNEFDSAYRMAIDRLVCGT